MADKQPASTEKPIEFPQLILKFPDRDGMFPVSDFLMGFGAASVEIQTDCPCLSVLFAPGQETANILQALQNFCNTTGIPYPEISSTQLQNSDWMSVFRAHFTPFSMNKNTFIVPSWLKDSFSKTKNGKQVVIVEPGQAFGTGLHATTALAADMITDYGKNHPRFTMIDAGSGSGILSVIAEKNGAAKILAFDIDPLSSVAMTTHITLNRCQREKFQLFVGSVAAIKKSESVDLVVINIIETIIRKILPDLAPIASDQLILSGILARDSENFLSFVKENGFSVIEKAARDEWVAFRCKRE